LQDATSLNIHAKWKNYCVNAVVGIWREIMRHFAKQGVLFMDASKFAVTFFLLFSTTAHAGPERKAPAPEKTPIGSVARDDRKFVKPIDIATVKGVPIVLKNQVTGDFAVAFPCTLGGLSSDHPAALFFGTADAMFQQRDVTSGGGCIAEDWNITARAPRVKEMRNAEILITKARPTYSHWCGDQKVGTLEPLNETDAKAFLAKTPFFFFSTGS
jgi:hypothetical protein